MKKFTLSFLVIAVAAAFYSLTAATQLSAQASRFSNVIAFATAVGRIGFFDQGSGRLYIYDGDAKTCLFTGQMTELGKPISVIETVSQIPPPPQKVRPGTRISVNERGEKTVTIDPQP